jgi:very-short-patch-repair endonuclease
LFDILDADGVHYEKFGTIGRYVPDALLPNHKVIIEVDGVRWHRRRVDHDRKRDRYLADQGYTVIHFTDIELTTPKQAREFIEPALADVKAGKARYRPPLLWRPGAEPADWLERYGFAA